LPVLAALVLGGSAVAALLSRNPSAVYAAPAGGTTDLSHVQFSGGDGGFWLFDGKNGNVYFYEKGTPTFIGRLTAAGERLQSDQAK